MKKKLTRIASLFAVVALCFSFLCIPVSAAESLSGSSDLLVGYSPSGGNSFTSSYSPTLSYPVKSATVARVTGSSATAKSYSPKGWNVPLTNVTGTVVLTLSYYLMVSGSSSITFSDYSSSNLTGSIEYTNFLGNTGSGNLDTLYSFTPSISSDYASPYGIVVSGSFMGDEVSPISNLKLKWSDQLLYASFVPSGTYYFDTYVISATVMETAAPSEDLKAMQSIAAGVAKTNEILSAMYGDILAVCNSIYSRCGDIYETELQIKALCDSVLAVLNQLDSHTVQIYNTMSTYFERVLATLDSQTLTLEEAIEDAESALELYLKPMIDYFNELEETTGESASSLPSHKTDLDGWTSDSSGIDSDAQTGLAAILPVFTAFSFIFSILGIFIGLGVFMLIIKKGLS